MPTNTIITKTVDGFILAGGVSSRFGSDKSRHVIDGQLMILRTRNLLKQICRRVVAVAKAGTDYSDLGIATISDTYSVKAPINGIATALGASTSEWCFIVACDLPALDLPILQRMWDQRTGAGVIPSVSGRLEPLVGLYNCSSEQMFKDAIALEQLKLQLLLKRAGFKILEFDDSHPFQNLNYRLGSGEPGND